MKGRNFRQWVIENKLAIDRFKGIVRYGGVVKTEHLNGRTCALVLGIRYFVPHHSHSHRRKFYEIWISTTVTMDVVGGSGVASALVGHHYSGRVGGYA